MEQKPNGALIGSIVIIIILIIGGIYFWKSSVKEQSTTPPVNVGSNTVPTDSSVSMEANLNNIDLNNLDQGI